MEVIKELNSFFQLWLKAYISMFWKEWRGHIFSNYSLHFFILVDSSVGSVGSETPLKFQGFHVSSCVTNPSKVNPKSLFDYFYGIINKLYFRYFCCIKSSPPFFICATLSSLRGREGGRGKGREQEEEEKKKNNFHFSPR